MKVFCQIRIAVGDMCDEVDKLLQTRNTLTVCRGRRLQEKCQEGSILLVLVRKVFSVRMRITAYLLLEVVEVCLDFLEGPDLSFRHRDAVSLEDNNGISTYVQIKREENMSLIEMELLIR